MATVHPRGAFRGLHNWWVHLQIGLCELDQDLVAFRTPVSAFHDVLHYRASCWVSHAASSVSTVTSPGLRRADAAGDEDGGEDCGGADRSVALRVQRGCGGVTRSLTRPVGSSTAVKATVWCRELRRGVGIAAGPEVGTPGPGVGGGDDAADFGRSSGADWGDMGTKWGYPTGCKHCDVDGVADEGGDGVGGGAGPKGGNSKGVNVTPHVTSLIPPHLSLDSASS